MLDSLAENGMAPETPREAREEIVHAFEAASPEALDGVATFLGICSSLFYGLPDLGTGRNPNWDAMGFPGPIAPPPVDRERPLNVRRPTGEAQDLIEADVVVIGSGAGGGVIAGELAATGKSVIVLEAGDYHDDADFDGLELSAYQRMFLNGGPFPTVDRQVSLLPAPELAEEPSSTGRTACAPRTTFGRSGRPSTASPTSPSRATTSTSTPSSSGSW